MYRILVVANETLEAPHLLDEVGRRVEASGGGERCAVHLVVPVAHGRGVWTEGGAKADAQVRLDDALVRFKELHVEVSGEVGDVSPVRAVGDALLVRPYDEIVLSTHPSGVSRWLKQDVPSRIRQQHPEVPLTHVSA
jgi:GABA permease